jgi:hypothetical protein
VPFKANAARRRRIPKQRYRITNWAEYDAALRQRGGLTVWFTEEAIAAWRAEPRTTRGCQPHYSPLAIRTALTLRAVFRLALRQTEGLIGSILQLLGLNLAVPDHSTLSRRAETLEMPRPVSRSEPVHLLVDSTGLRLCGPGEWLICESWDLTHQTVSDRILSDVLGAVVHPGLTTQGLGHDRRSSPVAAQRCARGAGLDGMAEPKRSIIGRDEFGRTLSVKSSPGFYS